MFLKLPTSQCLLNVLLCPRYHNIRQIASKLYNMQPATNIWFVIGLDIGFYVSYFNVACPKRRNARHLSKYCNEKATTLEYIPKPKQPARNCCKTFTILREKKIFLKLSSFLCYVTFCSTTDTSSRGTGILTYIHGTCKLLYMERKSMTIHDTESGSRISTYTI